MWKKGNPPTLLWECKLMQPLRKIVWRCFKKLKTELPHQQFHSQLHIRSGGGGWGRNNKFKKIYTLSVHNSIVYNCQNVKATPVSINRWMDKEDVIHRHTHTHTHTHRQIHTHTGILLSHQKEGKFAVCSNRDALGGYYAKWNKSEKDKYCITSLIWNLKKKTN